jgi:uncharacterized protein YkwD
MPLVHTTGAWVRSRAAGIVLLAVVAIGWILPTHAEARPAEGSRTRLIERTKVRTRLLELTNAARDRRGLRPLKLSLDVSSYATKHSARMASQGRLFHSTSTQIKKALRGTKWRSWGENVGTAPTLKRLQRAWMRSDGHRANILRRAFDRVGIGVVRSGRFVWATVVLYDTG